MLEHPDVLGPPRVRVGVVGDPYEPLPPPDGVLHLLPEVGDAHPLREVLPGPELPEPGDEEGAHVLPACEPRREGLGDDVEADVQALLEGCVDVGEGRPAVRLLYHLGGALGPDVPAGEQVGDVRLHPRLPYDVEDLQDAVDLVVLAVARGYVPPAPRPPRVGAEDPAVLVHDLHVLHDLVATREDVRVVVEADGHPDAAVVHRLPYENRHLRPLLLRRVALEVLAHDVGPDGPVAHEGRVVHRETLLLYDLEVLPHRVPVDGLVELLLQELVDLLPGEEVLVRVVLEGYQLVDELPSQAGEPDHVSDRRR